ncbi:hypothetical protein GEV33_006334 [Tenebrio molitor]|uniref:Uncharacterized protein n=1 Tax=Tenebrio molitor TaxID=7067 RepID=A0A8J6LDN0_TENMO|nr:hypothetical protein GEV33_006334 [Tenebrio molitor]
MGTVPRAAQSFNRSIIVFNLESFMAIVTGSEPKEPIRVNGTLKDRPVIRRPIRCQDGIDCEGPIRFHALGRTAPKATGILVPQLQRPGEEPPPSPTRFTDPGEEPAEDQPSMVLTRSQSSEEVEPNISSGASSMAPNKDQPEVSSAQVQSAMLEALQRTSHSLEEALERLSTRSSSPPSAAPPVVLKLEDYLPTFSGDPDEDPDYFIQRLEEYFAEPANAHLSEEVKVRVVHKQLRGPVFKRYKAFASRDREFHAVKDRPCGKVRRL